MPFSMLTRRLNDSFGNPVFLAESLNDTFNTLAWAAGENLLEGVSAYDDDIAPWTADNRGRVVDQQDQLLVHEMQDFLETNGLVMAAFGCDLTRDAMFRNGALTNPDDGIRQLALRKIERAAYIAKSLGVQNFRVSIGREGYEETLGVKWRGAFNALADGLNGITRFVNNRSGFRSIELLTGYSRHLRGHLYMGSPMQAAFMMSQLKQPDFWKLCIENDDISYMPAYSVLAATNSMAYMPFGGEDCWNWNAHISNLVSVIKMLEEFNWSGNAECMFAPLRTEADDREREFTKRQFITNTMTALTLACEQARRLENGWNDGLSPSEAGLMASTLCSGMNVDDVIRRTVVSNGPNNDDIAETEDDDSQTMTTLETDSLKNPEDTPDDTADAPENEKMSRSKRRREKYRKKREARLAKANEDNAEIAGDTENVDNVEMAGCESQEMIAHDTNSFDTAQDEQDAFAEYFAAQNPDVKTEPVRTEVYNSGVELPENKNPQNKEREQFPGTAEDSAVAKRNVEKVDEATAKIASDAVATDLDAVAEQAVIAEDISAGTAEACPVSEIEHTDAVTGDGSVENAAGTVAEAEVDIAPAGDAADGNASADGEKRRRSPRRRYSRFNRKKK